MGNSVRPGRTWLRTSWALLAVWGVLPLVSAFCPAVSAADFNWFNPEEKEVSAVRVALRGDSPEGLKALLYDGLDADQFLPDGETLVPVLSLAVMARNLEAVQFLVEEGADYDAMSTGVIEDRPEFEEEFLRNSN